MANRRMFSKAIVRTDAFLEMPLSSQCLYFHLGIEADDDGFVTPKMIMRTLGSNEDDLKVLIAKKFVMPFESGVIVIRHWKENNLIRIDRYKPTQYQEELKEALQDKVYIGVPMVNQRSTQDSIGKDSKVEERGFSLKPFYKGTNERLTESPAGSKKYFIVRGKQWLEFAGQPEDIEWR